MPLTQPTTPAGRAHVPVGPRRSDRHLDARMVTVRSEADIIGAVMRAHAEGRRVRAVGSGGSKNRNYATTGTQLDMAGYGRLIDVDRNRVTVEAGMPCSGLFALLRAHGLAITTPGEWNEATVGGAVSTGTHGGSARHGCLAASLCRIRLVCADGSVRTLERGSDAFSHAGVSLGLLGIVSRLTFECTGRFHLALERTLHSFDEVVAAEMWADQAVEYWSGVWFPAARRVLAYAANRCAPPRTCNRRALRYGTMTAVLSILSENAGRIAFVAPRLLQQTARGESHDMLSPIGFTPRRVRFCQRLSAGAREVEFAVPLERSAAILTEFDAFLRTWPGRLNLPVGLRATAGDAFSLSPCYGRDVLWIATFFRDEPRFAEALAGFFAGFDARCHWGKHLGLSREHLRTQYARWPAFTTMRRSLDPDNIFVNHFTEELGL